MGWVCFTNTQTYKYIYRDTHRHHHHPWIVWNQWNDVRDLTHAQNTFSAQKLLVFEKYFSTHWYIVRSTYVSATLSIMIFDFFFLFIVVAAIFLLLSFCAKYNWLTDNFRYMCIYQKNLQQLYAKKKKNWTKKLVSTPSPCPSRSEKHIWHSFLPHSQHDIRIYRKYIVCNFFSV